MTYPGGHVEHMLQSAHIMAIVNSSQAPIEIDLSGHLAGPEQIPSSGCLSGFEPTGSGWHPAFSIAESVVFPGQAFAQVARPCLNMVMPYPDSEAILLVALYLESTLHHRLVNRLQGARRLGLALLRL